MGYLAVFFIHVSAEIISLVMIFFLKTILDRTDSSHEPQLTLDIVERRE